MSFGEMFHRFCRLALPILLLSSLGSACDPGILTVCKCTRQFSGFDLDCSHMNFEQVIGALQAAELKAPIVRLKLDKVSVRTLEKGAFGILPIQELQLSNADLETIRDGALSGQIDDLSILILANNSIKTIPTFSGFKKLKVLDLSGNQITGVAPGVFTEMPNLQHLKLSRNDICTLEPSAMNEVKEGLTLLDLSGNCLRSIPASNIRGARELAWLDLARNKIAALPDLSFVNLPALREVFFDGNEISTIGRMAFMNVPQLEKFSIRANRMRLVTRDQFEPFLNMKVLDLRENLLTTISDSTFRELPQLRQILLDGNQIESVETYAFSKNPSLELVSLQNNVISELGPNAFDSHGRLTTLLLTNNTLSSVNGQTFGGMPNLQQLNLRSNAISSLAPDTFVNTPLLTSIDMAQNRLRHIATGTFIALPKLFWLDLSDNRIAKVGDNAFRTRVANLLINGNDLQCDESIDWFVKYLVSNNVRVFLPGQPDVRCAGPEHLAGTRLKELLLKRANDTFHKGLNSFIDPNTLQQSIAETALNGIQANQASDLIKTLAAMNQGKNIPLQNLVPGLRAIIPGSSELPPMFTSLPKIAGAAEQLHNLGKFTGPIAKLATGAPPESMAQDVNEMLQTLPKVVLSMRKKPTQGYSVGTRDGEGNGNTETAPKPNIPGLPPGFDPGSLDPTIIQYVLRGGKIPGIPDETLKAIIQQYSQPQASKPTGQAKVTGPFRGFSQLVTAPGPAVAGPMFRSSDDSYNSVAQLITASQLLDNSQPPSPLVNGSNTLVPSLAGLRLSGLHPEVIKALSKGKLPDLRKYPEFIRTLQENPGLLSILEDTQKGTGADGVAASSSPQGSDYNLDELYKNANQEDEVRSDAMLITGIVLGLIGVLTVLTLGVLCYRRRRVGPGAGSELFYGTGIVGAATSPHKSDFDSGGGSPAKVDIPAPMPMLSPSLASLYESEQTLRDWSYNHAIVSRSVPR